MIPTIDIPTLPPPIRIPSTAKLPTYPASAFAAPAPIPAAVAISNVKPFPLKPGEIWDKVDEIVWQVENPRCLFWRGALACGLRHQVKGQTLEVKTTLEELYKLLLWSWEQK